jgi:hypothetical protein
MEIADCLLRPLLINRWKLTWCARLVRLDLSGSIKETASKSQGRASKAAVSTTKKKSVKNAVPAKVSKPPAKSKPVKTSMKPKAKTQTPSPVKAPPKKKAAPTPAVKKASAQRAGESSTSKATTEVKKEPKKEPRKKEEPKLGKCPSGAKRRVRYYSSKTARLTDFCMGDEVIFRRVRDWNDETQFLELRGKVVGGGHDPAIGVNYIEVTFEFQRTNDVPIIDTRRFFVK